jgi:hypothetical protein
MTFRIGQRVRTTVDAPAADGFTYSAPAGTLGTITSRPDSFGYYGVKLDGDPYDLDASYKADEIEAAD